MSDSDDQADAELKARILAVLDENRIMCLATVRPDGWPQATLVGYAHDDLTLYFAVSAVSQKLENIRRDPRVSIAIGQDDRDHIRGLSMAALASVVSDPGEVERLNRLLSLRYPEQIVFSPQGISSALMRAAPDIISLVDHSKGPGQPQLMMVSRQTSVHSANRSSPSAND